MTRLFNILLLAAICFLPTTAAFTPDAAFKRKNAALTNPNIDDRRRRRTVPTRNTPQQEAAFANDRNMHLSSLNQENIRKSISVPPSYEDYIQERNKLMRLLRPNQGTK